MRKIFVGKARFNLVPHFHEPHLPCFQTPEPAKYEEELEKIKLDLATISTTYLLTKNMRSKWKSQATEGEEVVEEKEGLEEEIREEEAEEPKEERNGEDEADADKKEEDTVIDIE